MAVLKVPKEVSEPLEFLGDREEFGRPLFAQLVPFAVHLAASIYEERRERLINTQIIDQLEMLTSRIHETLQSLDLPGSLQALEKPLGLPSTLLSHAEELRQADAISRLQRSFADTAKLKQADESIYNEGRELLAAEAGEDERLRAKYGTQRWTRLDSKGAAPKLYKTMDEIDGYLKSSANSDEVVRSKYRDCEDMLRMLAASDRELGNFVPSSRRVEIPPNLEGDVTKLRNCLNDISRLESKRRRKIESIREKGKRDDINSSILAEAGRLERQYPSTPISAAQFEDFFEQRLARYDVDIEAVKVEDQEQQQLISQLQLANAKFVAAKRGDTSSKEREQALQKLENAYLKYKDIISNLENGRKFYNDLSKIAARFREDAKGFSYSRRSEAAQLES